MNTLNISKIEYQKINSEKNKLESSLKSLFLKKFIYTMRGNNLLDLTVNTLKGGPTDLSSKMDYYLYS